MPIPTAAKIASDHELPSRINVALTAAVNPITAPTETSISPIISTNAIPIDKSANTTLEFTVCIKFRVPRKSGLTIPTRRKSITTTASEKRLLALKIRLKDIHCIYPTIPFSTPKEAAISACSFISSFENS